MRSTPPYRIAALLCAGYGTRMGELTAGTPKPLLPVAGRPILDYLMERLLELPSLAAVHVVTNARDAGQLDAWADGWRRRLPGAPPLAVHDDGTRRNEERLGAVGDLAFLLDRLASERRGAFPDGALVAAGDNILRFSLAPLWRAFLGDGASRVLALRGEDPADLRRTAVLELDPEDGRVLKLHEKPEEPPSRWACPSIYCLGAAALGRVGPYLATGRPRDEIGRFVADLVERQPVYAVEAVGERLHVGSPESYRRADELLRQANQD